MKFFLAALGCLSFVLGVVGIFVPLLPTTPFLLLSAALWVRSSPRLYDWLLAHPCLGGYVRNFRENRAIPLRAKIVSLTLMWGIFYQGLSSAGQFDRCRSGIGR